MVDGFDPVREPSVQLSLDPSVIRASSLSLMRFDLFSSLVPSKIQYQYTQVQEKPQSNEKEK